MATPIDKTIDAYKKDVDRTLLYLALTSVELSRLRVAERVTHGGHSIADADIVRRFPRSLRNLLEVYASAVDHTRCFLNSGPDPRSSSCKMALDGRSSIS